MGLWLQGDPEGDLRVTMHPSLAVYMDWKRFDRLPYAGGVYDQDPAVLRDLRLVEHWVAQHEAREERRRRREQVQHGH